MILKCNFWLFTIEGKAKGIRKEVLGDTYCWSLIQFVRVLFWHAPRHVQVFSRTSPTLHWRKREKPGEVWEKSWISLPGGWETGGRTGWMAVQAVVGWPSDSSGSLRELSGSCLRVVWAPSIRTSVPIGVPEHSCTIPRLFPYQFTNLPLAFEVALGPITRGI
jgi:hypothetical protein